jgi:predicted Zn-dependent protease
MKTNRRVASLRQYLAATLLLAALTACATNPVTGRRELMLVSESQEVELGQQADAEARSAFGLVEDERLQSYVATQGRLLASRSERPKLPWTFRVVDDSAVNAFALPGGFVYMTRGILTHLNSEAEMAAVLGHEIGHVTARHSARRLSQAQFATLGLGIGMILEPELRRFGGAAEAGLGLLFLKFGRDDERQADDLGLRYMTTADYSPGEMVDVFRTLERASADSPKLPGWLSTHPNPGDRIERVQDQIARTGARGRRVLAEDYLNRIDGLVFGENPREGYFEGRAFYHPDLRFRFEFPQGWKTQNARDAVGASSPRNDALVVISLAKRASAEAAARAFLAQPGIQIAGSARDRDESVAFAFQAAAQQGALAGLARFVEHEGRVLRLLGYTRADGFSRYRDEFDDSLSSFGRLTDRRRLDVQPARLRVVRVDGRTSVRELAREHRSGAPLETLALINGVASDGLLPGPYAKIVAGETRFASDSGRERRR